MMQPSSSSQRRELTARAVLALGVATSMLGSSVQLASANTLPQTTYGTTSSSIKVQAVGNPKMSFVAAAPAEVKGAKAEFPVVAGAVTSSAATLEHAGTLTIRRGKRSITIDKLVYKLAKSGYGTAVIDGKKRKLFSLKVSKKLLKIEVGRKYVDLAKTPLVLSKSGRKIFESKLGIKLKSSVIGSLRSRSLTKGAPLPGQVVEKPSVVPPVTVPPIPNPQPQPYVDTYGCQVPTTAATPKSWPPPLAVSVEVLPQALATGQLDWAVRSSLRGYALSGDGKPALATFEGAADTAPLSRDGVFNFPIVGGSTNADESRFVVNGRGLASFCYPAHGFRFTLGNPTLVLSPGTNSGRLIVDIAPNFSGVVLPASRVDFATFDVVAAPSVSGQTYVWTGLKPKLTDAAATALGNFYTPGTEFAPISLTIAKQQLDTRRVAKGGPVWRALCQQANLLAFAS